MKRKTLIYIIGAGRSGTTILDIILGNAKDSLSLGEFNRFFKRDGKPPKRKKSDAVYVFWKKVREDFEKDYGNEFQFTDLDKIVHANEYHTAILRSLSGMLTKKYKLIIQKQYGALFKNSSETILIESSKYPLRAYNILRELDHKSVEIKFVYLKKDPVKVVQSFQKKDVEQPSKGLFASNIYYFLVNTLCLLVMQLIKMRHFSGISIRYENLLADPVATLAKIEKTLGINLQASRNIIAEHKELQTGCLFDGNRIRLAKTLVLRKENISNSTNFSALFTRAFNYIIYR